MDNKDKQTRGFGEMQVGNYDSYRLYQETEMPNLNSCSVDEIDEYVVAKKQAKKAEKQAQKEAKGKSSFGQFLKNKFGKPSQKDHEEDKEM